MSKKIYIGNLPYSVTEEELREMFTKFGEVTSADLISDKYTGQSKGFGFVEMDKNKEATEAINSLNDKEIDGRKIVVNEAKPREERSNNSRGGSRGKRF